MKRILLLLVPACLAVSSCGILSLLLNGVGNTAVVGTPAGAVVNPIASTIAAVAPNPKNLQATEDRGTGLYGYLNEFGSWVIAPTFAYAVDFDEAMSRGNMYRDFEAHAREKACNLLSKEVE